jgi:hypothetical protein
MSNRVVEITDSVAILKVDHSGKNTQKLITVVDDNAKLLLVQELQDTLNWLSPLNFSAKQNDIFGRWHEGTGQWLLENIVFKTWVNGISKVLWCPGIRMVSCSQIPTFYLLIS